MGPFDSLNEGTVPNTGRFYDKEHEQTLWMDHKNLLVASSTLQQVFLVETFFLPLFSKEDKKLKYWFKHSVTVKGR